MSRGVFVRVRGVGAMVGALVLALHLDIAPSAAQEVIDLPGQDREIASNFEEVYRVGSFDGDTWETFGEIAGAGFDEAGNLYLLDRQAALITVIDPEGNYLKTIGGPGEGPGEFRMALSFGVTRDGRAIVMDLGHRSYQLFDPDGEFERMVGMDFTSGAIRVGGFQPYAGGNAVLQTGGGGVQAMARTGGGGAPAAPTSRPIELISLAGSEVEATTLVEGWMPPAGDGSDEEMELEGGGMRIQMSAGAMPRTWEPALLAGTLPDGGVVFSDSTAYTIKVANASGGVDRVIRRPFSPTPVTERMEEAERERRLAELEAGDGPQMRMMVNNGSGGGAQAVSPEMIRGIQENQISQMRFYPELPVVTGLSTSWTGKVWVERRGDEPEGEGPIDVLTAAGQYVGTLPAGATATPDAFGPNGVAAFIEEDDFGVPVVVVRRLPAVVN